MWDNYHIIMVCQNSGIRQIVGGRTSYCMLFYFTFWHTLIMQSVIMRARSVTNSPPYALQAKESVGLFAQELYPHEPYLVFLVVSPKLVERGVDVVGVALAEVLVDVVHLVFVHCLLQEIVDVHLRA